MAATSRRRARGRSGDASVVPGVLKRKGVTDPLWHDYVAVERWCLRHGVPVPHEMFWGDARAMRDQVTFDYARSRWPGRHGLPDWHEFTKHDVAPMTGARVACRVAWQSKLEQQ